MHRAHVLPGVRGGAPSVYADWLGAPGQRAVLLYGHYDVQPAEPLAEWRVPPFRATVRDGKIYGRGSSDDKGQLLTHLCALESYLTAGGRLPVNVKVWIEGEEELGSPTLEAFLDRHADALRARVAIVSDTEIAGDRPSIVYGLRGALGFELEVLGRPAGAAQRPIRRRCARSGAAPLCAGRTHARRARPHSDPRLLARRARAAVGRAASATPTTASTAPTSASTSPRSTKESTR